MAGATADTTDKTVGALSQILFTLAGVDALSSRGGQITIKSPAYYIPPVTDGAASAPSYPGSANFECKVDGLTLTRPGADAAIFQYTGDVA